MNAHEDMHFNQPQCLASIATTAYPQASVRLNRLRTIVGSFPFAARSVYVYEQIAKTLFCLLGS